jgi:hypothetical protein
MVLSRIEKWVKAKVFVTACLFIKSMTELLNSSHFLYFLKYLYEAYQVLSQKETNIHTFVNKFRESQ